MSFMIIFSAGNTSIIAGGALTSLDGYGPAAGFLSPRALAIDSNGGIYVAEYGGKIRKIIGN